jgi:hypothetical protein
MRITRILAGGLLLTALGPVLRAQAPPYQAAIDAEVDVRSGPSPMYYPTGKLRPGDRVTVREEKDGGWLAIDPPPQSHSWIESRVLGKHSGWTAHVMVASEVPVRAGSPLVSKFPPEVVSAKLKPGTQVLILGPARIADDGTKWWPIQPQNEFRYIPKTAVKVTPVVETVAASNPGGMFAGATTPEAVFAQAEKAREAGQLAEARRLYELCASLPGADAGVRSRCWSRLEYLKSIPGSFPLQTAGTGPYPPTGGQAGTQGQAAGYGPRPPAGQPMTSFGWLRRAPFLIGNQPAYALQDSQGRLLMYVTAQPGLNLEPFVERNVTLSGSVSYLGELKRNHMLAIQVQPLQ